MENKYLGNTVAFIPLRGGSKSIPHKNIKLIKGRPLVYWTLDAATNCEAIDKVIVSTDDEKIKNVVKSYCSDKVLIIDRSEAVSTDVASTESVMLEFAENYDFKNILLIQATSPLLTKEDLYKGVIKFNEEDIDSVLSVVRQKRFIWKTGETTRPVNYNLLDRPRRQEFDGFLVENGAVYITSKNKLLQSQTRISGNIAYFEMADSSYYEIDEPSDWTIVETLLESKVSKDLKKAIAKIKCVLTDNDGVLTDAGMYYSEKGDELKKFNTKDGLAFSLLKQKGYITGIITGEDIDIVKRRAKKMGVDECHLGITNKLKVVQEICLKYRLNLNQVAYLGDDINDLEVIKSVGLGVTVNDGAKQVKCVASYITEKKGGKGAFREFTDLLLGEFL